MGFARNPKSLRLRASRDFRRVMSRGRRSRQPHLVVVSAPGAGEHSRVGLAVGRRVGNAVVRNRVKRWLREATRHNRHLLAGTWDVVLVAHPSAADSSAELLETEIRKSFQDIGRRRR